MVVNGGGAVTPNIEPLVGADLILLLLAAPTSVRTAQHRINGVTRMEKLLFLADKEADIAALVIEPLEFIPYNFGPYSKQVYEAVDILEEAQLLSEERNLDANGLDSLEEADATADETDYVERRFLLTDKGKAVSELLGGQHADVVQKLSEIKNRYAAMSLRELIRYVYTKYPPLAEKSLIRDQFL